jgi:hypothetical protein
MKIIKIISQHRRDFKAEMECEGCGCKDIISRGYDDRNYHDNVIPKMKCKDCGKSREDLGITAEPTKTKYNSWEVV